MHDLIKTMGANQKWNNRYSPRDMTTGGVGRGAWGAGRGDVTKVGHATWNLACIGEFDQISASHSFIYLIYFIVSGFLSIVFIINTVE